MPNCFLCWDGKSAEVISKWAYEKSISVEVIGNPWFIRFYEKKDYDTLVKAAVAKPRNLLSTKPTILVSLQWGLDKESIAPDQHLFRSSFLPYALEQFIKSTCEQFNWLLRCHPIQLNSDYSSGIFKYLHTQLDPAISSNCLEASLLPLPVLLSFTNLHITYFSSVTIESCWFDIPTALLDPQLNPGGKNETFFLNERESGLAQLVECDSQAIKIWVEDKLKNREAKSSTKLQGDLYYKFLNTLLI